MRDRLDELGPDTDVVLVTFTDPANLAGYANRNRLPFPVLTDPTGEVYRAFGFGRGALRRVWGWRAGLTYLRLLARGRWRDLRRPTEDTRQLGGDIVIAPDGTIAWGFWGPGPDDRPSVDAIIAAVEATR